MAHIFEVDLNLVCDMSSKLDVQRTQGKVDSSRLGVRLEIHAVIVLKAMMIGIVLPLFMANPDQMISLCTFVYKDLDLQSPPVSSTRKHGSGNSKFWV